MKERIAVIDGIRTPFCKAGGVLQKYDSDDLGAFVVRELLKRLPFPKEKIDEVIIGNVISPPHAYNVARVITIKGGLPNSVPAITVSRNCASGMEAVVIGCERILLGKEEIVLAGGAESMSHVPILFNEAMKNWLMKMRKTKGLWPMLKQLLCFRPSFLKPVIPAIADPLCGLTMGETAEILAREFSISREAQDNFSCASQKRAEKAMQSGAFAGEIVPLPSPSGKMQLTDDGIRSGQTIEQLKTLRPSFDKLTGTVTPGNSSQITDGAAGVILMKESLAKKMGLKPLGFITGYAFAGLDPSRMGLGPVFATAKLFAETKTELKDIDLIEINEAFAAQVLAVVAAFKSDSFCEKHFGRKALGTIDLEKLNVNGGAIALGHPLGASGTRIILSLLRELKTRGKQKGLATLCVGGGQGEAVLVEVE